MPPTNPLATAIQHHQAGRLHEAEQLYRQVLASHPNQPDALHLLGVIAHQVGRNDAAVELISSAIRQHGFNAEMHSNLGSAFMGLGRFAEAAASYQRALQLQPNFVSARYNLGNVFLKSNRLDEAIDCYQQALRERPNDLPSLMNLGNARRAQKDLPAAEACFRRVIEINPGSVEAYVNLGIALQEQRRFEESVAAYRQAMRLNPNVPEAHYNLGNALQEQGQLAEALVSYREALRIKPNDTDARVSMGNALRNHGELEAAIDSYEQAIQVDFSKADAHFSLGLTRLLQGKWDDGWPEYEWRWRTKDFPPLPFAQPRWDGFDLKRRTILLTVEQGLGDTVQFVRYAPLVRQRGAGSVVLRCQEPLIPLLTGVAGVDAIVGRKQPLPAFDCYAALMSLPGLFKTTPANVPGQSPYFQANSERRARWRAWLDQHPGRKIGVCWRGSNSHREDHKRSVSLAAFAPLAQSPNVRLVSLQVGDGREDLKLDGERLHVLDPGLTPDEQGEAFQELAALISELDLVVSVDTVIVHLAGALGVPTWVGLPSVPDWRWMMEREDTPWYPSVRLFRQPRRGDWDNVFARMAEQL